MSKSDVWENALLLLLFQNTTFANVGDVTGIRGSTAAGSLFWGLNTADPGEAGTQTTSESAYTSYARVAAARSSGGFTVTTSTVNPAATVSFPACTGLTSTVTFASIGAATSGTGILLYSGAVSPTIAVSTGVTPQLTTASAITED